MEYKKLQIAGGISAIFEALIYISAFIVYGGVLVYPGADASKVDRLAFLSDNYLILTILNLVSYVLFGILLAVLVLSIHQRLKSSTPIFSKLVAVFGFIWVGLVIASGMISNIGLDYVIKLGAKAPEDAMLVWSSISVVAEGLGGGNEIVGGIWVLLLSIFAIKGKQLSKPLNYLGIVVGTAGVLTIFPLDTFKEVFGLSQIVWFFWMGIYLVRKPSQEA